VEVPIAIETYDDLFSDFDVRDYSSRALSWDFLDELRVRMRWSWKKPDLKVVFLIPPAARSPSDEALISARIQRFYQERSLHYRAECRRATGKTILFIVIGLALSVLANLVAGRFDFLPLFNEFLLIPAWFFVWSGLDLLGKRAEIDHKRRYYGALSASGIEFRDYPGKAEGLA
jgi:hypothetical protein